MRPMFCHFDVSKINFSKKKSRKTEKGGLIRATDKKAEKRKKAGYLGPFGKKDGLNCSPFKHISLFQFFVAKVLFGLACSQNTVIQQGEKP